MSKQYPYDLSVFIGRFQPLHLGHEELIRKCFEVAHNTLILIGSSTSSRSFRNPFTYKERREMIQNCIKDAVGFENIGSLLIAGVPDSAYNFTDWLLRVKKEIQKATEKISVLPKNPKIAIIGHFKDDTSYYLDYFPEFTFIPVDATANGVGATEIREKYFSKANYESELIKHDSFTPYVSESIYSFLWSFAKTPEFDFLKQESEFIQSYKKQWSTAPYPPTFVTTDSIVVCMGHVLVIKRGRNPGKGYYALPGGFLEQTESIQEGCLRELKEETHIDLPKRYLEAYIKDSHVFDHPLRDPRGRTITHAFLFDLDMKTFPTIRADDDASEVLWLPLHKLEEYEPLFFLDHAQIVRYFLNRMR